MFFIAWKENSMKKIWWISDFQENYSYYKSLLNFPDINLDIFSPGAISLLCHSGLISPDFVIVGPIKFLNNEEWKYEFMMSENNILRHHIVADLDGRVKNNTPFLTLCSEIDYSGYRHFRTKGVLLSLVLCKIIELDEPSPYGRLLTNLEFCLKK